MSKELTIVIAAYNAHRTIARAVASALAVDGACVIVVDDGSTDSTSAVAERAGAKVIQQPNAGAASARRAGLRFVKTPFVGFLDADDCLLAIGVEAALGEISNSLDAVGICGRARYVAGRADHLLTLPPWPEGITVESMLARAQPPAPPSAIIWRSDALKVSFGSEPTPLEPRFAEDYELALRVANLGKIIESTAAVCDYGIKGGKSSARPLDSLQSAEQIRRYYAESYSVPIAPRTERQLRARVRLRKAFEARVERKHLRAMAHTFLGLCLDSSYLWSRLRKTLGVQGSTSARVPTGSKV